MQTVSLKKDIVRIQVSNTIFVESNPISEELFFENNGIKIDILDLPDELKECVTMTIAFLVNSMNHNIIIKKKYEIL